MQLLDAAVKSDMRVFLLFLHTSTYGESLTDGPWYLQYALVHKHSGVPIIIKYVREMQTFKENISNCLTSSFMAR